MAIADVGMNGDESQFDPYKTTAVHPAPTEPAVSPPLRQIGRYRIERVLGEGAFGRVLRSSLQFIQRASASPPRTTPNHTSGPPGRNEMSFRSGRTSNRLDVLDHPDAGKGWLGLASLT